MGFAQDMIHHHQQAVEMATIELYGGSDPQVQSLAYDILTSQTNQIGQMQSLADPLGLSARQSGRGDGLDAGSQ